jgi:hypothetical protein
VVGGVGLHAVAQRGEDGHYAAEAVELGDEVGEVEGAEEREVAGVCGEEAGLFVLCCGRVSGREDRKG